MKPKFKKGDELFLIKNFKKMVVETVDISIESVGEANERISVCYWDELDKGNGSRDGHSENYLTKSDCTKALLEAKKLILENKYSFKIFDEETDANKAVEKSLSNVVFYQTLKHLEECIKNIS